MIVDKSVICPFQVEAVRAACGLPCLCHCHQVERMFQIKPSLSPWVPGQRWHGLEPQPIIADAEHKREAAEIEELLLLPWNAAYRGSYILVHLLMSLRKWGLKSQENVSNVGRTGCPPWAGAMSTSITSASLTAAHVLLTNLDTIPSLCTAGESGLPASTKETYSCMDPWSLTCSCRFYSLRLTMLLCHVYTCLSSFPPIYQCILSSDDFPNKLQTK